MVITGGGMGLAAGIVSAPAIGATVSALGFGAAGGTLTGAAASSAGLAALGGGSLATGGLGMAGGTVIAAAGTGSFAAMSSTVVSRKIAKQGKCTKRAYNRARGKKTDRQSYKFE